MQEKVELTPEKVVLEELADISSDNMVFVKNNCRLLIAV